MTTEVPNVSPTGRYPMTKVAKALALHRNTLARYVKEYSNYLPVHYHITGEAFILGKDILRFWKAYDQVKKVS